MINIKSRSLPANLQPHLQVLLKLHGRVVQGIDPAASLLHHLQTNVGALL